MQFWVQVLVYKGPGRAVFANTHRSGIPTDTIVSAAIVGLVHKALNLKSYS
jgi:hypothetical protein